MINQKTVKGSNQKYEQVSQKDDNSEIIIFETKKKISVSFAWFLVIRVVLCGSVVISNCLCDICNTTSPLLSRRWPQKGSSGAKAYVTSCRKVGKTFFVRKNWMKSREEIKVFPDVINLFMFAFHYRSRKDSDPLSFPVSSAIPIVFTFCSDAEDETVSAAIGCSVFN